MRTLSALLLCIAAPAALAQARFPEPDWEHSYSGDQIYTTGYTHSVGDSGPIFLMVSATYRATAPDNGNRRNTTGKLVVSINGNPCGYDNYGNEIHTSVAAGSVYCFVRGTGPYTVTAKVDLKHCCQGGNSVWNHFLDRHASVNIYAFRAETPATKAEIWYPAPAAKKD